MAARLALQTMRRFTPASIICVVDVPPRFSAGERMPELHALHPASIDYMEARYEGTDS
jgi:hypothetical protein